MMNNVIESMFSATASAGAGARGESSPGGAQGARGAESTAASWTGQVRGLESLTGQESANVGPRQAPAAPEMMNNVIEAMFSATASAGHEIGEGVRAADAGDLPQRNPRASGSNSSPTRKFCASFNICGPKCEHEGPGGHGEAVGRATGESAVEADSSFGEDSSNDDGEQEVEDIFFAVSSKAGAARSGGGEMDKVRARCAELRKHMRLRPTLPLRADGEPLSVEDLRSGMKLPLYSCPFVGQDGASCQFQTRERTLFLHHIAGGVRDRTHADQIVQVCKTDVSWMTRLDYVQGAIAVAERVRGLAWVCLPRVEH